MTDVLAKELDRHDATDVYVFEVSGALAREMNEWSDEVQIRFDQDKQGRMWLLIRKTGY